MVHTIAPGTRKVLNSLKKLGGTMAILAAFAGTSFAGGSTSDGGVPEINTSSLLSALTLVIGGVLMIHDTRRRSA
jgi:hypothetical protein